MRLAHLPDYVLSEAEDRARRRYLTPSNISPWYGGVSKQLALTVSQCDGLRERGMDPKVADWMWVTVPITEPVEFDNRAYGRAVQHIACPIVRTVGKRIEVLTPRGRLRSVYAGGRLSDPTKKKAFRGVMGRG